MDIIELLKYDHASRRRYLDALKQLPWNEVVADRGASFSSIRNIFLHALDVEDRLINYVIPERNEDWISYRAKGYDRFNTIGRIERRVIEVEENVQAYLEKLTPKELNRRVMLPWRKGILIRVEDVLLYLLIEDISHYGELIALFWQINVEPPFLSWHHFKHPQ
jgi:uncharacterized damage-inducible protein DinB